MFACGYWDCRHRHHGRRRRRRCFQVDNPVRLTCECVCVCSRKLREWKTSKLKRVYITGIFITRAHIFEIDLLTISRNRSHPVSINCLALRDYLHWIFSCIGLLFSYLPNTSDSWQIQFQSNNTICNYNIVRTRLLPREQRYIYTREYTRNREPPLIRNSYENHAYNCITTPYMQYYTYMCAGGRNKYVGTYS